MMNDRRFSPPGIPDKAFFRKTGVPMTKEEIRAVSISKLRLYPEANVIDIGAGSGSITVEASLLCPFGKVYAVEKDEEALEILEQNIEKFNLANVEVVRGEAPAVLAKLPRVERIFVGGSGGNLEAVLKAAEEKLLPGGVLVVNGITLETGNAAVHFMEKRGFVEIDISLLNVSKGETRGRMRIWRARNPVQVVAGYKVQGRNDCGG